MTELYARVQNRFTNAESATHRSFREPSIRTILGAPCLPVLNGVPGDRGPHEQVFVRGDEGARSTSLGWRDVGNHEPQPSLFIPRLQRQHQILRRRRPAPRSLLERRIPPVQRIRRLLPLPESPESSESAAAHTSSHPTTCTALSINRDRQDLFLYFVKNIPQPVMCDFPSL